MSDEKEIKAVPVDGRLVKGGGSYQLPTNTTQNQLIDRYVQNTAQSSQNDKPSGNANTGQKK
jgi:hypothetical protein